MRDKLLVCVFGLKQPECHLRDYRDLFSGEGGGAGGMSGLLRQLLRTTFLTLGQSVSGMDPGGLHLPPGEKQVPLLVRV